MAPLEPLAVLRLSQEDYDREERYRNDIRQSSQFNIGILSILAGAGATAVARTNLATVNPFEFWLTIVFIAAVGLSLGYAAVCFGMSVRVRRYQHPATLHEHFLARDDAMGKSLAQGCQHAEAAQLQKAVWSRASRCGIEKLRTELRITTETGRSGCPEQ